MFLVTVLVFSVLLQTSATIMAVRLFRLTGKSAAWSIVAIALFLMVFRRLILLYYLVSGNPAIEIDMINEVIGLVISLLLLAGMTRIHPLFLSIKQSGESARQAEEKYRSLFDNANDAIYLVVYGTLKILDFNRKASEMLGYSKDQLKNMNFTDLHPNIEKNQLRAKLSEIKEHGGTHEPLIFHHKKCSGEYCIIEMNVSMIEIKSELLVFSIVRDITERKTNEDKIRLFFQATDNSAEAVVMCDLDKRIIYANTSFEGMFGYSRSNIIGKKVSALYPEKTWEVLQRSINPDSGSFIGELTGKRSDGNLFPILLSSSLILNDDGYIIARMSTFRDITGIKKTEAAMITYTEQLRSLSDHLSTVREEERLFLAREIHDGFGSSLTGLKMDLTILKRNLIEKYGSDESSVLVARIQSMLELVDSTIDLMRRLVRELRPEVLDELGLAEAVRWYVKEFENRTYIKFHLTVFPKNIEADKKRTIAIFRIFQEILVNIARHSKATEVRVFLKKQEGNIHLLVHDNGIGIKAEDISNRNSHGILGMQERALVFGGNLKIEGEDGRGTTVKVEIPVK